MPEETLNQTQYLFKDVQKGIWVLKINPDYYGQLSMPNIFLVRTGNRFFVYSGFQDGSHTIYQFTFFKNAFYFFINSCELVYFPKHLRKDYATYND